MKNWAIDWRKLATAQRRFFVSTTLWKFRWLLAKKKLRQTMMVNLFIFTWQKLFSGIDTLNSSIVFSKN
jgi:hypothetical protein